MKAFLLVIVCCVFWGGLTAEANTDLSPTRCKAASRSLEASAKATVALQLEAQVAAEVSEQKTLLESDPLLLELRSEFQALEGLGVSAESGGLVPAREDIGAAVERLTSLSLSPKVFENTKENSEALVSLTEILQETPDFLPEFMGSDLVPIIEAVLRHRLREGVNPYGNANFSFEQRRTFDLQSVGRFLSVLASFKDLPLLLDGNSDIAIQILTLSSEQQVASRHLNHTDLSFLLRTSMSALTAQEISKFNPRDVYLLAKNLRNLKLNPTPDFQEVFYSRIVQMIPEMSFQTLLSVTLDLSFAGFSPNQTLFDTLFDTYRYKYLRDQRPPSNRIKRKQLYFFNSVAGALFNFGSPVNPSFRFKELFEASGLDIFSDRIFKVQAFYLYDFLVLGKPSNIMNLVNEKSASDLVRPQVFKPAGSASSLEVRVAKALDSLFPNKDIITEHPIHPWLPDVDFFLVEDNVIIEVQGPYHNRKVMEDSEDGELLMRRQTGNSFDRGKYDIFKAMGYRVIELELEHLRGSIEDIAKLITRRLEQPGDRL